MPVVVTEAAYASSIGLILNPTSDGYPNQLDIGDGGTYRPKAFACPPPNPRPAYASSYDTEGSVATDAAHYENREITIGLWVFGSSAGGLELALNNLQKYVGQINREGGVLKMTTPNNTVCYFDLEREGAATVTFDPLYTSKHYVEVEVRFMARPFWRGAEISLGTVSETTLPALVATFSGVDGDVPALGRLVITDTESGGQARWTVIVGGESRYYSNATTAKLFYEAEDFTPTGTSTKTAGATGASGGGSNVVRNTDLTTTYQAILRSEVDATNLALTHKGTFRVWARLYRPTGNTGAVSVRLEWAEGDYTRVTLNDPVSYAADEREGVFTWANLGIVSIDPSSTRWEFRLLAKSTVAGDEIDADCFFLPPTEVVYGEFSAKVKFENPSSFSGFSNFTTEAGAITGDSALTGGAWVGAGDADDFSVAAGVATRTAVSDTTGVGRYISLNLNLTSTTVQVDFKASSTAAMQGVLARYAATTDWFRAMVTLGGTLTTLNVQKNVAGVTTNLTPGGLILDELLPLNTFNRLRLQVLANGIWIVWAGVADLRPLSVVAYGQDSALATGGALANGDPGIYDEYQSASANTRTYASWFAAPPTPDAAIFATRTFELRHDKATRKDSTGTFSSRVSYPNGSYLRIPASGPEGRSTRLAVLALPNDPYTMGDAAAIYDLSAQLYVTPRGLVIPEA